MSGFAMEKQNSKIDQESGQGNISTYIDVGAEVMCPEAGPDPVAIFGLGA